MIGRLLKKMKSVFTVSTLLRYSEKVGTFGCALPLLHFAALPFSVFFYVIKEFLSRAKPTEHMSDFAELVVPATAISGFYWLLAFWIHAAAIALVVWGLYRSFREIFPPGTFAGAIVRTLMAFTVTSGFIERFIANEVMSMTLDALPISLTPGDAPAFDISLYSDLGALVRSPYWEIGQYSLTARYSFAPLVAFTLVVLVYFGRRIAEEVRIATRGR